MKGIRKIKLPRGTIIQFACDADETVDGTISTERNTLYTKALLRHIVREQVNVEKVFKSIEEDVYRESNRKQRPSSMSRLPHGLQIYFNYAFGKFNLT
jgi:hypothetical protein